MEAHRSQGRLLRVVDIETTGPAPPAEILELGWVDLVEAEGGEWTLGERGSRLFRPIRGIPPENRAIHHINPGDIGADAEPCTAETLAALLSAGGPFALVAHNADFERRFITDANLSWICTYKCAVRVWPEAPRHSNQVLRYWLNLDLDPTVAMPAHRAGPDAVVTAHILLEMLRRRSLEELAAWSGESRRPPVIRFGRHRGEAWSDIPSDYLTWIVDQGEMGAEVKACAENELRRRAGAAVASRCNT